MPVRSPFPRRRVVLCTLALAIVAVAGTAIVTAATLVPAPVAVLPPLVLVAIAAPTALAFELAGVLAARAAPHEQLRRELDRLPETPHPLGY